MSLVLLNTTAPPIEDLVVDKSGRLTMLWKQWFGRVPATLASIPNIFNTVSLSTQAASITATDFSGTTPKAGVYRITYHARITRAATTSSTLTVTLAWTEGGVGQSAAGAAMIGNTTTTIQSDTLLIRSDAAAVTYATTYGSVGATTMQYSLD